MTAAASENDHSTDCGVLHVVSSQLRRTCLLLIKFSDSAGEFSATLIGFDTFSDNPASGELLATLTASGAVKWFTTVVTVKPALNGNSIRQTVNLSRLTGKGSASG